MTAAHNHRIDPHTHSLSLDQAALKSRGAREAFNGALVNCQPRSSNTGIGQTRGEPHVPKIVVLLRYVL
jgi:hypothetical protein